MGYSISPLAVAIAVAFSTTATWAEQPASPPCLDVAVLGQGTTMNVPSGVVPLWGTPVPGMGRSLYAGLNVNF